MPKPPEMEPMTLMEILHHAEVFHDGDPSSLWDAANQTLAGAVKKAIAYQKPTGVVIELKFVPTRQGGISLVAKLTGKEPAHVPLPLALYTDSRGRIFHEDPRQLKFQDSPNVVPMTAGEPKKGAA